MRVHLDPGHYGSAYNHGVFGGYVESNFTWEITNKLKAELEKRGVEVTLSRYNKDDNPALTARGGGSKDKDLFISLHSNACSTPSVRRVVVIKPLKSTTRASQFAQGIGDLVTKVMGLTEKTSVYTKESESTKGADYYGVIRGAVAVGQEMAFILEHSFHTNAETCKWLLNEANANQLAVKEAEYICEFFGVKGEPKKEYSTKEEFKELIAKYAKELAPKYGIKVVSPVVAQAILESGWGTSNKAKYNNFFGLKYREGRLTCHSGTFVDGSSEQLPDGTYVPITDQWYSFKNVRDGVEGYFQYTNISRYSNLKGVTDAFKYVENIKADGYATSLSYVENVSRVIRENNLTKYDTPDTKPEEPKKEDDDMVMYKVQAGAYTVKANAEAQVKKLKAAGFDAFIVEVEVPDETPSKPALKDNLTVAREVWRGDWGNGAERKQRLEAAGYNYVDVQSLVNQLVHGLIK